MSKIRGVDLDIHLNTSDITIELPDGTAHTFACCQQVGQIIQALQQHYYGSPRGRGLWSGTSYQGAATSNDEVMIKRAAVPTQPIACWWCGTSNAPGMQRCQQCGKEIG